LHLPFIELEITCSKGTYIRTLAHDLGTLLGTGAHLTQLCRIMTSGFRLQECVFLEQLDADARPGARPGFIGLVEALRGWPQGQVNDEGAARLRDGIPPLASQVLIDPWREGELVALIRRDQLLAVARCANSRREEKRGDFELLRVFPEAAAA
jgi:tRNA pseudouridine55 synthase